MMNLTDIQKQIATTAQALAKADSELKWELAASAADVAGIVDPTPASDLVGAGLALRKGDFWGAGLSVASMIPYAGDALAKPAKAVRAAARVKELQKTVTALNAKLASLQRLKKDAIAATENAKILSQPTKSKRATDAQATGAQRGQASQDKNRDCEDCKAGEGRPNPVARMPQHRVEPCFSAGKLDPSKDAEFSQQLKRQEEALNRLTVAEFESARAHFKAHKRTGTGKAQKAARASYKADLIAELTDTFSDTMPLKEAKQAARKRADEVMKDLAALHEPDMIAGGSDLVKSMGDRGVNSSIGSQWRSRVEQLDRAAAVVPVAEKHGTRMNIKLPKCR